MADTDKSMLCEKCERDGINPNCEHFGPPSTERCEHLPENSIYTLDSPEQSPNLGNQLPKAREWLYVGNFISQRGEKYTSLDGPDIGSSKVWLVEKSAFDAERARADKAERHAEQYAELRDYVEKQRDEARAEVERLKSELKLQFQQTHENAQRAEKAEAMLKGLNYYGEQKSVALTAAEVKIKDLENKLNAK